jgi:hypothetical protein
LLPFKNPINPISYIISAVLHKRVRIKFVEAATELAVVLQTHEIDRTVQSICKEGS